MGEAEGRRPSGGEAEADSWGDRGPQAGQKPREPWPESRAPPAAPAEPEKDAPSSAAPEMPWGFLARVLGGPSGAPPRQQLALEASERRTSSAVDGETFRAVVDSLESKLQVVRESSHPVAVEFLQALEAPVRIVARLLQENEQLQCSQQDLESQRLAQRQHQQQAQAQEARISQLLAENQRLRQELQEAKRSQKSGPQKSASQRTWLPWSTAFPIQVRVTGQTGDCEKQFLEDVSKHLSGHRIQLQVENYREDSGRFLLVFCPVASRMGSDIENALEGLSNVPKAALVVLHHKPKDYNRLFVDTKLQAQHPSLVRTVHARYTVQEGFYACQMNEAAVAAVAEIIKEISKEG